MSPSNTYDLIILRDLDVRLEVSPTRHWVWEENSPWAISPGAAANHRGKHPLQLNPGGLPTQQLHAGALSRDCFMSRSFFISFSCEDYFSYGLKGLLLPATGLSVAVAATSPTHNLVSLSWTRRTGWGQGLPSSTARLVGSKSTQHSRCPSCATRLSWLAHVVSQKDDHF